MYVLLLDFDIVLYLVVLCQEWLKVLLYHALITLRIDWGERKTVN